MGYTPRTMTPASRHPHRHRFIALLLLWAFLTGLGLQAHAALAGQGHEHSPVSLSADDAHAGHSSGAGDVPDDLGPTCCHELCPGGLTLPPIGNCIALRGATKQSRLPDDAWLAGLRHPPPLRPPR